MHSHRIAYPAVPQDTFQAANSLYGKGNIYLRLGDHLDELLVGLIPPHMNACWMKNRTFETNLQCAMLTVFQFVEVRFNGIVGSIDEANTAASRLGQPNGMTPEGTAVLLQM